MPTERKNIIEGLVSLFFFLIQTPLENKRGIKPLSSFFNPPRYLKRYNFYLSYTLFQYNHY